MILYAIVRALIFAVGKVMFRATMEGREHIPPGPFVLAPVHRSFLDFGLVSMLTRRRMRYMGKESLWKSKLFGRFISHLGAYPVHRGTVDRESLKRTIEIVQRGEPVVIFPEGTRRTGPVVETLFEGAAYVAGRCGVPLVPVGIGGSERAQRKGQRFPRPVKIHMVVGPPIPPPPKKGEGDRVSRRAVHEVTERLQAEMQRLFDEAQVKAGA